MPAFPDTQAPLWPHPTFITISEEQMQGKNPLEALDFWNLRQNKSSATSIVILIFKQNKKLVRKAEIEDGL